MSTTWIQQPKRAASNVPSRVYNVAGQNYDTLGILYAGAYAPTAWSFINKTS